MLLFSIFQFTGLVAFAVAGALLGVKKGLDFFGVIMLAATTALGGGIVRDMIIGNTPPVAFQEPIYFIISTVSAICVLLFYNHFIKLNNIILIFDAIGLGIFTALGANLAVEHGIDAPFIIVSLGLMTGIGGSILRDVFLKEIPYVFRKEIYALASIIGAVVFVLSKNVIDGNIPLYLASIITLTIRLVVIKYNIDLPVIKFQDEEKRIEL